MQYWADSFLLSFIEIYFSVIYRSIFISKPFGRRISWCRGQKGDSEEKGFLNSKFNSIQQVLYWGMIQTRICAENIVFILFCRAQKRPKTFTLWAPFHLGDLNWFNLQTPMEYLTLGQEFVVIAWKKESRHCFQKRHHFRGGSGAKRCKKRGSAHCKKRRE